MSEVRIPMTDMRPVMGLVVYRTEPESAQSVGFGEIGGDKPRECYVEIRKALQVEGMNVWGEAKPLSLDTVRKLVTELAEGNLIYEGFGLFPGRVLSVRADGDMVWYAPAARRPLFVDTGKVRISGQVWYPAVLFALKGVSLYAFALKTEEARPGPSDRIYRLPLPNCYGDGAMCMGSARVDRGGTVAERMERAEESFFQSTFNRDFSGEGIVAKGDVFTLWSRLYRKGERFPLDQLVSVKQTLRQFIQEHGF